MAGSNTKPKKKKATKTQGGKKKTNKTKVKQKTHVKHASKNRKTKSKIQYKAISQLL